MAAKPVSSVFSFYTYFNFIRTHDHDICMKETRFDGFGSDIQRRRKAPHLSCDLSIVTGRRKTPDISCLHLNLVPQLEINIAKRNTKYIDFIMT